MGNIESDTITTDGTNFLQTGSITSWDPCGEPYLIDTIVNKDSIELVYRQDSNITYATSGHQPEPDIKIFKIVYSCKKGKWHESERIEGEYISAEDETYEF